MLIKQKLPTVIALLVAIPLILLSIIIFNYTSQSIIKSELDHIREISMVEKNNLNTLVESQKKEIELMSTKGVLKRPFMEQKDAASIELNNSLSMQEAEEFLKSRVKSQNKLEGTFLADKNGIIICGTEEGMQNLDIKDREYFKSAIGGNTAISNVLKSRSNNEDVVVFASPVRDETGSVLGVIGDVINTKSFTNFLNQFHHKEDNRYAFLVDSNGIMIAHIDPDKVGKPVENDKTIELVNLLKQNKTFDLDVVRYRYNGEEKLMGYCLIEGLNWILSVTEPVTEIINPATQGLRIVLITLLVFLIASIAAGIKFSSSITNPIIMLMEAMKKAEEGDLNAQCDYNSKDELGSLAQGFNIMLSKLNISVEELTAVYEELSATEEELRAQYDELQENGDALKDSEEKYRLALDSANDAIWEYNLNTKEFFASDKWTDITGSRIKQRTDLKAFMYSFIYPEDIGKAFADLTTHLKGETSYYRSEFRIRSGIGRFKWVSMKGKALRNSKGRVIKLAGSLTDISERKKSEENIRFLAYYDSLTGLPNRLLFIQRLNASLEKSLKEGTKGAVLFIDLDDFKNINDTLGHDFGDLLLEHIARAMEGVKRECDTICRFGGDEFLILRPEIDSKEQTAEFADKIIKILNDAFDVEEKQLYITGSIGVTIYPDDGVDTNVILKNADTAMYKAKEAGKNKFTFYSRDMYDKLERKTTVEKVLRNAIVNNELHIYYQPQFDIETTEISGFEALLRLKSEEIGFVSPAEFIPIAEETGLIVSIGEWVLRKACEKNKEWQDKGYKHCCMAVNISSIQLQQPDFLGMVKGVLNDTGLPPKYLELEITESVLMKSLDDNVRILNAIRQDGVKIALDDFGTGYSSLNYLRKIPIDTLKMDKSFIDGICLNPDEEAIAGGIIQLAHQMRLEVVAEGVEEQQQLKVLFDKKCDKVQGYLFSKPLPVEQIEVILNKGKAD